MNNIICLNEKYSTTQLLTQEEPEIITNPEDKFESVLFLPVGKNRKGEGGLRTKGYFKKSFDGKPLISIITVVYNGEQFLEETIQSVINQTYDNIEYIIVDGESTDGTIDIIKKYEDRIDYWVSERDDGIYDAMNKGITIVSESLINFMNAGDLLIDKSIIKNIFIDKSNSSKNKILTGFVKIVDENKIWKGYRHPNKDFNLIDLTIENCIAHQATFVHKNIFKKIGLFSLNYEIQGDYEFWLRAKKHDIEFISINLDIALFLDNGTSSNRTNFKKSTIEKYKALSENGYIKISILYIFKEIIKFNIKNLLRRILGVNLSNTISENNLIKLNKNNKKIIYDLSIAGATRAGVFVFAKKLNDEILKNSNFSILNFRNPFSSLKKSGLKRKINSLLRLLYLELIVLFGNKDDIYFFPAPEVPLFAIILKKKYIVTIHDLYAWKNSKETTSFAKFKNMLLPIITNNAYKICTVSKYSKIEINHNLNIDSNKIFIVHNGLDNSFIDNQYNTSIDLLDGIDYILNVGSLEPRKNIVFLISVFEKLKETLKLSSVEKLKLVLTGSESWNNSEISQRINNSIYKNDILILDHVSQNELPLLYKNASAMIFPSKAEGFGIPVIESLSQGTPVIVNKNTALQDFDQYGAIVINNYDISIWTNVIKNIIHKNKRIEFKLTRKVIKDFSWEQSAHNFIEELK
jgi:glycosyltransferase involved in cell wall biosynthesis